ncbi:YlbF/YmcA family competence regulator [Streptococcus macacae]|uniref:UPF0342 protein STRMA_0434 n=1 Tax=Streptococcus macacae NCTC 11558 TaxID=764298 RepID=G5JZ17_9STRE|nr:YlbF/YmcA family competence regulator [Streptococcus macacae]EHJ52467.1 hypothetical protein STRMA_0434 [Streptococcus macacae NCTC 11558]SUN78272.1 hypothetical cytosolic protein [Streptococcus macacae NCTC 11558]
MSENIYDLANELERGIRALPEYQTVKEAKEKIEADEEAKKLWDEFMTFQEKIQTMMQTGQMPTPEIQQEMQDYGQKIEANPVLKQYAEAQQAFGVYINDIERIVFSPLQDLNK